MTRRRGIRFRSQWDREEITDYWAERTWLVLRYVISFYYKIYITVNLFNFVKHTFFLIGHSKSLCNCVGSTYIKRTALQLIFMIVGWFSEKEPKAFYFFNNSIFQNVMLEELKTMRRVEVDDKLYWLFEDGRSSPILMHMHILPHREHKACPL